MQRFKKADPALGQAGGRQSATIIAFPKANRRTPAERCAAEARRIGELYRRRQKPAESLAETIARLSMLGEARS
jgi:hypothetical protein